MCTKIQIILHLLLWARSERGTAALGCAVCKFKVTHTVCYSLLMLVLLEKLGASPSFTFNNSCNATLWFEMADKISNLVCFTQSMPYHLQFSARSEYLLACFIRPHARPSENIINVTLWKIGIPTMICYCFSSLFLSPFPSSLVSLLRAVLLDRTSS